MPVSTPETEGAQKTDRGWPTLARAAVAGFAGFAAAIVVGGALYPDYSHSHEFISALAAADAKAAWVMIAGFAILGLALALAAIMIWRRVGATASGTAAAVLVGLSGALTVVVGLARQDCSDVRPSCIDHGDAALASTQYQIHNLVSLLTFLLLIVALFFLARAQRKSQGWAHLAVPTRIAAGFSLIFTLVFVFTSAFEPYSGLAQRVFVTVLFGWPILSAGLAPRATS